jgi:2-keto-3-deoxy-L-rhamnonate aldolase RhmA
MFLPISASNRTVRAATYFTQSRDHCGAPSYAKQMIEMGFRFVTVGGDTRFLTMGAAAAVREMRGDAPANPARAGASSPY